MFIACYEERIKKEIVLFDRLYAYPRVPDISGTKVVILDSGAFALSKRNGKMDDKYLKDLAVHYKKYSTRDNVLCISADVFKSPSLSMSQFLKFNILFDNAVPVLQFATSNIDLFDVKKQIRFYAKNSNQKTICISNNKFDPIKQKKELSFIVETIINHGFDWIHVLGAGYSHNDVKDWHEIGVNSIDSISYYTDAQSGVEWISDSYRNKHSDDNFKTIALKNLRTANEILY